MNPPENQREVGPKEHAVIYRCEPDINGCNHTWKAMDAGDVFLKCPRCEEEAGAIA